MRLEAGLIALLGLTACTDAPPTAEASTSAATSSESGEPESESESGAATETETGTETGDTDDPPENLFLSDQVLNIAHRGGGVWRPEATLPPR